MKITKEMLAELRERAVEADRITDVMRLEADEFLAIIDERKALRAELRAVYDGEGANSQTSRALALGEDE